MKPGDTVITQEGKEGKVSGIDEPTPWFHGRLIYVDFEKPNPHWKVFVESELKLKPDTE